MAGGAGKRFTDNTKAARILKRMFQSGEVTADEQPNAVYTRDEEFQKFDSKKFGEKFRKFKSLYAKGRIVTT